MYKLVKVGGRSSELDLGNFKNIFLVLTLFGIEQKGMTFDHDFFYSLSFSSALFLGGKRKEEEKREIPKVVFKKHAFLLDLFTGVSNVKIFVES